jgi:hypothetical protein
MLLLEIGGWIILSCILMSFIEHQVHEKLMHKRNFLVARRLTLLCITSITPKSSAMSLSLLVKTSRYG